MSNIFPNKLWFISHFPQQIVVGWLRVYCSWRVVQRRQQWLWRSSWWRESHRWKLSGPVVTAWLSSTLKSLDELRGAINDARESVSESCGVSWVLLMIWWGRGRCLMFLDWLMVWLDWLLMACCSMLFHWFLMVCSGCCSICCWYLSLVCCCWCNLCQCCPLNVVNVPTGANVVKSLVVVAAILLFLTSLGGFRRCCRRCCIFGKLIVSERYLLLCSCCECLMHLDSFPSCLIWTHMVSPQSCLITIYSCRIADIIADSII